VSQTPKPHAPRPQRTKAAPSLGACLLGEALQYLLKWRAESN